jgi:hypothetical protein
MQSIVDDYTQKEKKIMKERREQEEHQMVKV